MSEIAEHKRKIDSLRAGKGDKPTAVYRSEPLPTEGNDYDERIVELNGTYYRYIKLDGVWRRTQLT
jgi:hypothetical protein